jgi:Na+-driven multidrug efflux pump
MWEPAEMKKIEPENPITQGPLVSAVLHLAGPAILMMYLQGAYNIIDTIWVGQLLGKQALAGIAAGGFVLWSMFGMANLVAVGIAATLARRMGEGDRAHAEYIAKRGLWYAVALSAIIGLGLWLLMPALFLLMGTDSEVTRVGSQYLEVILAGCPLIFLSFTLHRVFQAAGDTVTPMWLMFVTLLINTALDPVLMIGLFGIPPLGVAGAALATVLSRLLVVGLGLWLLMKKRRVTLRAVELPLFRRFPAYHPAIEEGHLKVQGIVPHRWDWQLFGSVVRIGLPTAVSQTLFPAVYMVITRLPAAYGTVYVAALRIGHTVEGISFFLALGFSVAAATCVGQNLGAGSPTRSARAAWVSSAIATAVLLVFSLLFYRGAHTISSVFSSDPATIAASADYLQILAYSQVFMGLEIVLSGAFAGAGDTVPPMIVFVPLNVARIPLAYLLAHTFGLGVLGVWWAISGTSILKGSIIALWFCHGGWKEKRV